MYNERIYMTPKEILDYEFKVDARGYRPEEVDKILDMVIRDETEYINTIKKLEKDIRDLTEDNIKLKQELRRTQSEIEQLEVDDNSSSVNNIDLLKRLSQLEKIVYSKFE